MSHQHTNDCYGKVPETEGKGEYLRCGKVAGQPEPPAARPHRIGVWDYESAIECLKSNWEQAFPNEPFRDPQDAIQRMAATIMQSRQAAASQPSAHYMQKLPGGICFAHGLYETMECPKWPACATDKQNPEFVRMGMERVAHSERKEADELRERLQRLVDECRAIHADENSSCIDESECAAALEAALGEQSEK
jgi:hypothetical protein